MLCMQIPHFVCDFPVPRAVPSFPPEPLQVVSRIHGAGAARGPCLDPAVPCRGKAKPVQLQESVRTWEIVPCAVPLSCRGAHPSLLRGTGLPAEQRGAGTLQPCLTGAALCPAGAAAPASAPVSSTGRDGRDDHPAPGK